MSLSVGIVGRGAIGGYLGLLLGAAGVRVTFVERPGGPPASLAIDVSGREHRPATLASTSSEPSALAGVDVCIVSVKSFDTTAVGQGLAAALPSKTPVVSFQNGLENVGRLQGALGNRIAGGVVTFNVRVEDGGVRRQLSAGKLMIGRLEGERGLQLAALASHFEQRGQPTELRADIRKVIAGKLLLNLNNGVCAATGVGIAESLSDPDARWCYAQCIREGARVMREADLHPARVAVLPAELLARALALPQRLLGPLIHHFGQIQRSARSSTLQDLDRHQRTEIDELNGAILKLAREHGARAPANGLVTDVVHRHERSVLTGVAPQFVAPRELRKQMTAALEPT